MMININQQQNQEQQEGTSLGMYMREFLDCIYEVRRPSLNVSRSVLWAGDLNWMKKKKKKAELHHDSAARKEYTSNSSQNKAFLS